MTGYDFTGVLLAIHTAPEASAPMVEHDAARLVEGVGIEGDRYATARGTYSHKPHADRQVTLIEMETLDALARDHGIDLAPHETRRNLTTAGVPLNHLVGREFRVGEVVLVGGRLNVPCQYLEDLLGKKVFKPLIHRSGLNCRIVKGGTIRPGDRIVPG
jgi:MOSC domain-containing protein YiiM